MRPRSTRVLAAGLVAAGIAACSTGGDGGTAAATGNATPPPKPKVADRNLAGLTGTDTDMSIDPATATMLRRLKIAVTPFGAAKAARDGVTFPITGGGLTVRDPSYHPAVSGEIDHFGSGFILATGKTSATITDFVIDPATGTVRATVAGHPGFALFTLDSTGERISAGTGTATFSDETLRLSADSATALNGAFHTDGFTESQPFGTATITARTG